MTGQELAQFVMTDRGLNRADARLVKTVGKRVQSCLRHHRTKGLMRSLKREGQHQLWEITN